MKNIYENGRWVAIDGEEEFDLGFCGYKMEQWRKQYMRKNSKHRASIRVCIDAKASESIYWIHKLQLFVNGTLKESLRIREEASDTLTRDIAEMKNGNNYHYYIEEFEPAKK